MKGTKKMERWNLLQGTVPLVLSAAMVITSFPMNVFASEDIVNSKAQQEESISGENSMEGSLAESKLISAIYGTTEMTYYEYYQKEVGESIAKDEDGYYDAVTSATKGSHTSDIASIHKFFSTENNTLVIDGLNTVDVVINGDALSALLIEMEKDELTTEDYIQIAAALSEKGITITYLEAEGTLYDIQENVVSEDADQKLDIAYAKPLNVDLSSYGKNIAIEQSSKNTSNVLDYVANNQATATVNYASGYGDYAINIHYSGTEGATGMGIGLAGDSDKSIWNAYKNNVYAVTFTNDSTADTYGAVWYEDIWSEGSHGTYLEVAINKEDRTIKSNTVKAGRYKDMQAGTYTATVKSRGYEDVVVGGIEVGTILSTKPTLKNNSFSTEDTQIGLELETEGVDNNYVTALDSASYSLTRTVNRISSAVDTDFSLSGDGKAIVMTPNDESFAYGAYTLTAKVSGFQTVTYSFNVISSQSKLSMQVGDLVFGLEEAVNIKPGTPIYLVDETSKEFVEGYGSDATVSVNGTTISSKGPNAVAILKYNATDGYLYIDTTTSPFAVAGTYEVSVTSTGFTTYTYSFTVEEPVMPTVSISKSEVTLYTTGDQRTGTLTSKVTGDSQVVDWTSSNTKVVKVESNGKVTAVGAGTAIITASANGVSATCKVTVKKPTIKLNKTSATIYTKGTKTVSLKATVVGANSIVDWTSNNKKVAKVDKNGKVTAVKVGKVTITGKANGASVTCKIVVKKASISLSKTKATIKVGKKVTIKAIAKPSGKISYKINNKKIATVSSKGVVKGKKKGTTTITISCNGLSKEFKVTVK